MEMRPFDEIIDLAVERHGGRDMFDQMLAETRPLLCGPKWNVGCSRKR
jgi:hypothetical protein